jgi:hypothetical protein
MNAALEEIKTIPGVLGGLLYHPQKGVLESDLPAVFKEPKLLKMGRILVKMYSSGRSNFSDLSELSIYYEESLVIIRELKDAVFLIIVGAPDLNMNLLTMTLNLLMEELDSHSAPSAPPPSRARAKPKQGPLADALLERGPMAESLKAMQSELAKVVGPMSKIIFMDALNRWIDSTTPSPGTYPALVDILADEIDDPEKMAYYQQLIAPYLDLEVSDAGFSGRGKNEKE